MLRDLLLLRGVTVTREVVTPDGLGDSTTTSSVTTLPMAQIWGNSQSKQFFSQKNTNVGTHTLVTLPSDYTFTIEDDHVSYGGVDYDIAGPSDNIMFLNEITVTPLVVTK